MAVTGQRALAIAVLRQAIRDAAGIIDHTHYARGVGSPKGQRGKTQTKQDVMDDARAWLTDHSDSLAFWCDLAQIDESVVLEGVEGAIARIWQRSRSKKGTSNTQAATDGRSCNP